jgi:hypothetical protein
MTSLLMVSSAVRFFTLMSMYSSDPPSNLEAGIRLNQALLEELAADDP